MSDGPGNRQEKLELERSGPGRRRIDWNRLFNRDSSEAALAEIAKVLGTVSPSTTTVREPGDPEIDSPPAYPTLSRSRTDEALEAWKAARENLATMERRLEARTRELGLLQLLGRKAAEARTGKDLFSTAAEVLQDTSDLELIVVTHRLQGVLDVRSFLARPVESGVITEIAEESVRFLRWEEESVGRIDSERLNAYDDKRYPLKSFREQDLVTLPVMRRGTPVACLTLLHSGKPDEGRLRVLYSAANQLSMHIDRILTVQDAEESRFRSILDSMPQAVVLTDDRLRVVQANPAAVGLQDRLGIPTTGGIIRRVGKIELETLVSELRGGERVKASAETRLAGGEVFDVTLSLFHAEDDLPGGYLLIVADVTESRRLQEQLTQAEKMSSIGHMISGVAHELNNPLASIMGYAQLLQATTADEKLSERLGVLYQESRRCKRIVQKLLSFVRRHEPEQRALSINEIASSVIALMRYQLRVDGVEVDTELDLSISAIVGDGHQLQQALLNLVTNAQQAIRAGGGKGRIVIRTSRVGEDRIALEVEDDGPGVPGEIRSRIFDPFFTTKPAGEGTGLGLSLVYGTINAHGGTIRAEEGSAGGARFVIELPAGMESPGERTDSGDSRKNLDVPSSRILVVDDEESIVSLIRETLVAAEHEVVVSSTGEEALERLDEHRFDLIILDYRMPGMGGESLYRRIRQLYPAHAPAIILTSADTVSGEPDLFADEAGIPLLHKPFDLEDLHRVVRDSLLESHKGGS